METKDSKTDSRDLPQRERKHPPEWEQDLNPNRLEGQNIGVQSSAGEIGTRTAYDVKRLHRGMREMNDAELKRIPVLPEGERLQQGATYLDLADEQPREFTATGEMSAGTGQALVPKDRVPYALWNRLIGESKPGE